MNMITELQDVRHGAVLRARMRIAGELVGGERTIDVHNPYTGSLVGTVPKASVERDPARLRHRQGLQGDTDAPRPLPDPAPHRGDHPQPGRADLGPHHRRVRDLQEGLALRSRPRLRRLRLRRQCGVERRRPDLLLRSHAARQAAQGLHAARAAAGRDLRDHAVQPSAEPGRAQGRAVDRDEQPDGAEAHREDAALRAAPRRHPLRGRTAARDVLGGHRRSARDRRRDADQPGRGPRHVHRRRSHRQVHRGEGGLQAPGARAGRQRPDHRAGGRRPRRSGGPRRRRLVQELRPALHGDQAHPRPRGRGRRASSSCCSSGPAPGPTATRWIRRWTWAP